MFRCFVGYSTYACYIGTLFAASMAAYFTTARFTSLHERLVCFCHLHWASRLCALGQCTKQKHVLRTEKSATVTHTTQQGVRGFPFEYLDTDTFYIHIAIALHKQGRMNSRSLFLLNTHNGVDFHRIDVHRIICIFNK